MAKIDGSKLEDLILMFALPFFIVQKKSTVAWDAQDGRVATDRIVKEDDTTMVL